MKPEIQEYETYHCSELRTSGLVNTAHAAREYRFIAINPMRFDNLYLISLATPG